MERLFAAIPGVLNDLGANSKTDEAIVVAAWKLCAGGMLSERTAAIEFFDNQLVVAAADETWRRHLEDLCPQMLVKLNAQLGQGTVRFIEFVIDPRAIKGVVAHEADKANEPIDVDPRLVDAADSIANEKLREQFLSTAAAYLTRQDQLNNGR